jgi:metal-dependent amidase/aminoacylase/carboxypeptidase family protein
VVLTIGSVRGGEAGNVIPDSVEANGTMRTFSPKVQDAVPGEMKRILKGVTEAQVAVDFLGRS